MLLINDQRQPPALAVVTVQRVSLGAAICRSDAQLGRVKINSIPILHNSKSMPAGQTLLYECVLARTDDIRQPNANQQWKAKQRSEQQSDNQQDDAKLFHGVWRVKRPNEN